jgi:hypothetical protein
MTATNNGAGKPQVPRQPVPCTECPARRDNVDNPRAKFPAARWEQLRATVETPWNLEELEEQTLFGCHKGDPRTGGEGELLCAGVLAAFGFDSVKVKMAVHFGRLDPAALHPGEGWPELYATWDEMVENQTLRPGDPTDHLPPDMCELNE